MAHGGAKFGAPTRLTPEALTELESLNALAPLHNPPALAGIRAARAVLGPDVPMVAVFDTTFHRTLPEHAAAYALPHDLARRHGLRRYGFHGLAHESVVRAPRGTEGLAGGRLREGPIHPDYVNRPLMRATRRL